MNTPGSAEEGEGSGEDGDVWGVDAMKAFISFCAPFLVGMALPEFSLALLRRP